MMMMMRIYGEDNSQNETTINQYYSRHKTTPEDASRRQEVNGWGGGGGVVRERVGYIRFFVGMRDDVWLSRYYMEQLPQKSAKIMISCGKKSHIQCWTCARLVVGGRAKIEREASGITTRKKKRKRDLTECRR